MTLTMKKLLALLLLSASLAVQADAPVYGPELQGFDYPAPVLQFSFKTQGQDMHILITSPSSLMAMRWCCYMARIFVLPPGTTQP